MADNFINKDDAEVSHMETASQLKVESTHVLVDANRQSYYVKKVCYCESCLVVITDKRVV